MSNVVAFRERSSPWPGRKEPSPSGKKSSTVFRKHRLVDHVLPVNRYFPPESFYEDLSANLRELLSHRQPPSQAQLAEAVGRLIGHEKDWLVVANGVAELMSILLGRLGLRVTLPAPSLAACERTGVASQLTCFDLPAPGFELDIDALVRKVLESASDAAAVVSPSSLTSRAVSHVDLVTLAERLADHDRLLIVDETFIEFILGGTTSSLEPVTQRLENLVVVKSLGEIHGVCGLRIGYMLSSNRRLLNLVRRHLPTPEGNTLGEYFLSRMLELADLAAQSWTLVRRDRDHLFQRLDTIPGMLALPPDANFVFCRLPPQWPDGPTLVDRLLEDYGILICHGSKSLRDGSRYLRLAARSIAENERLVGRLEAAAEAGRLKSAG